MAILIALLDLFFLPWRFLPHSLPVYELKLPPDDYVAINRHPGQSTAGKFSAGGKEYNVKVGYLTDEGKVPAARKKPWQIEFDDRQPFAGQTQIDLIVPQKETVFAAALIQFRAKSLGLITPPGQFIVLKVNGQSQGVFWQRESWNEAFLEKQNLPVGNLYGVRGREVVKLVDDETYSTDHYTEMAKLIDLVTHASDEEFNLQLPYLLDIDNFLTWEKVGILSDDLSLRNKFYWHPAIGKFYLLAPTNWDSLKRRVLANETWSKRKDDILAKYNSAAESSYYDQLVKDTRVAWFQDYWKDFSNFSLLRSTNSFSQDDSGIDNLSLPENVPIEPEEFEDFVNFSGIKEFSPGRHLINQNLIVPAGGRLIIKPGAKLLFAPGVSLISYSPVTAVGTAAAPIVLTAQDSASPWGVLAAIGNDTDENSFDFVTVEFGSQAIVNGANFTGALAVHRSGAGIVTNSVFRHNRGDDGLNIKYSRVLVNDNLFTQNDWDGFDLDFGAGEITNNQFIKNGNDGLDLGSASPLIENNLVDGSGDKCISLGETSVPVIIGNTLRGCEIGIAVKDSSQPEINDNTISNNHIGIAAYLKKPIFPMRPFTLGDNILINNDTDMEKNETN